MSLLLFVSLLFSQSSPEDLAKKVSILFNKTCSKCHELKDIDKSLLLEKIQPGGGMPKGKPPLSKEEVQLFADWLKAGAPFEAKSKNKIPDFDIHYPLELEIIRILYNDLRNLPEDQAKQTRYLTLTHLWAAGATEDELNIQRQAIQKLVNSLSWESELVSLIPIDKRKTIYRLNLSQFNWDEKDWDAITKQYPYIVTFPDDLANLFYKNYLFESKTNYIRGDWFVFAAARPPLYNKFIFKEGTVTPKLELFNTPIVPEKNVARAAIKKSGVSKNNRIIERRSTRYGAYWQSYDFNGNSEKKDIFKNPVGFEHAGGEIIFNLPNGLQAYILTNDKGKGLDEAPIDIVRDSTRPDGKIINGISCMSCHQDGMHAKYDDLLPVVDKFPDNYKESITKIRELYKTKEELKKYFADDQKRYKDALSKLSVPTQINGKEQVRMVSDKFEEDLDLKTAAAELGISTDALKALTKNNAELDQIVFRLEHGGIARDTFISEFRKLSNEILSRREKQLHSLGPYAPLNKVLYSVQFDLIQKNKPPIGPVILPDGETALLTSRFGTLSWMREGKIIHEQKLKEEMEYEPLIQEEKVIVATKEGSVEIFAWDEKQSQATLISHLKIEGRPSHSPVLIDDIKVLYASYDEKKQESFLHQYKTKDEMQSVSIGDGKVISIKKIKNNKLVILTNKQLLWFDGKNFKVEMGYDFETTEKSRPQMVVLKNEEVVLSVEKKVIWLAEQNNKIEELASYSPKIENALIARAHNNEDIFLKDKSEILLVKRVDQKIEKIDFVSNENKEYRHVELLRDYKVNNETAPAFLLQERLEPSHFRVFTFKMKRGEVLKMTPDIGKTTERVHFQGGDVDMVTTSFVSSPVTYKGRESFIVTTSGGYAYVLK